MRFANSDSIDTRILSAPTSGIGGQYNNDIESCTEAYQASGYGLAGVAFCTRVLYVFHFVSLMSFPLPTKLHSSSFKTVVMVSITVAGTIPSGSECWLAQGTALKSVMDITVSSCTTTTSVCTRASHGHVEGRRKGCMDVSSAITVTFFFRIHLSAPGGTWPHVTLYKRLVSVLSFYYSQNIPLRIRTPPRF